MKKNVLLLIFCVSLFAELFAQNVGIGTNLPRTKLNVNGALSFDEATAAAAASVVIPNDKSLFRLTATPGVQANALSVTTPQEGQFLTIRNEDGDDATFAGFTIAAGKLKTFVYSNSAWREASDDNSESWHIKGNAGITEPTAPVTYGTSTILANENRLGTTDARDLVFTTDNRERMRLLKTDGRLSIGSATANANTMLTLTPYVNGLRNGIIIPYPNTSVVSSPAIGIDMPVTTNENVSGFRYSNSSTATTTAFFGSGAILTATNVVSGFQGYRNNTGLSYGLYGINGTTSTYATNANTWALFSQGRAVISSESSPTSPLGVDLEVRNTSVGVGNPAVISLRQTTSNTANNSVLGNINFGDNYRTAPQAQVQCYRDGVSSSASDLGTGIKLSVVNDNASVLAERLRVRNNGIIEFDNNNQDAGSGVIHYPTYSSTGAAAFGWNPTAGGGDVAFWNNSSFGSARGFNFIQQTAATTRAHLARLHYDATSGLGWLGLGTRGGVAGVNAATVLDVRSAINGSGVYFVPQNATCYFENTHTGGTCLVANNTAASGTGDGDAIEASTIQSNAFGVWAINSNTTAGVGVVGTGGSTTSVYPTVPTGSAFNGIRFGSYNSVNSTTAVGTNYVSTYAGTYSFSNPSFRTGASTSAYQFGVVGQKDQDFSGSFYYDLRSGGLLGVGYRRDNSTIQSWGAVGYKSSTGIDYGLYTGTASAASTTAAGGGGFLPKVDQPLQGMGLGATGTLMGGWARGGLMGFMSAGDMFAAYNQGNEYTSGYQADLVNVGSERKAAYSVTSTELKLYEDGRARLNNGQATVSFPENFKAMLGEEIPNVTLSALGDCKGIYITDISRSGFTVNEMQGGGSNVPFTWIAVGKRKDARLAELPADIASAKFDEQMKGVMFDELQTEKSGTPIWYDGHHLRFEPMPKELDNGGAKLSADEAARIAKMTVTRSAKKDTQ